ncbi:hypothetical protein ACIBSW_11105 [Actinoplanes sp. NPDC049668]|uniref:Imm32 family immunity protein n=1 Tax=unclassified Actinoplanes TaxID=2626549 RepID=UPI0033A73A2C
MRVSRAERQQEMEISGTTAEFLELARMVRAGEGVVQLNTTGDPWPYDHLLSVLEVHAATQAVVIRRSGDTLTLAGGATAMGVLALVIEDLAADEPGADVQIDYFPDHVYLGEGSRPMILVLTG